MDDGLLFSEMYFGACTGGGGGGSAAYGMTYAPKALKEINDSLNEAKETVKEVLFDVATYLWDAYMESLYLQQEAQLQQAFAISDFVADRFSTPVKAKNTFAACAVGFEFAAWLTKPYAPLSAGFQIVAIAFGGIVVVIDIYMED